MAPEIVFDWSVVFDRFSSRAAQIGDFFSFESGEAMSNTRLQSRLASISCGINFEDRIFAFSPKINGLYR